MKAIAYTIMSLLTALPALAEASPAPPHAEIANSVMRVKLYLPDADAVVSTAAPGSTGRAWWRTCNTQGIATMVPGSRKPIPRSPTSFIEGSEIVAGPCSAITGPVEEFTVLGYDEAKPGGTFLKIGVGILRKPDEAHYSAYRLYEIVNGGKWSVKKSKDAVEFTQELHDASSGYGYVYHKKLSLVAGKPQMLIEHSLKNVGHARDPHQRLRS